MPKKHVGFRLDEDKLEKVDDTGLKHSDFFSKATEHYLEFLKNGAKPVEGEMATDGGERTFDSRDLEVVNKNVLAVSEQVSGMDLARSPVFAGMLEQLGHQHAEIKGLKKDLRKSRAPPKGYYNADEIVKRGGFWGPRVLKNVQRSSSEQ